MLCASDLGPRSTAVSAAVPMVTFLVTIEIAPQQGERLQAGACDERVADPYRVELKLLHLLRELRERSRRIVRMHHRVLANRERNSDLWTHLNLCLFVPGPPVSLD